MFALPSGPKLRQPCCCGCPGSLAVFAQTGTRRPLGLGVHVVVGPTCSQVQKQLEAKLPQLEKEAADIRAAHVEARQRSEWWVILTQSNIHRVTRVQDRCQQHKQQAAKYTRLPSKSQDLGNARLCQSDHLSAPWQGT
jgi:hypothetical protein